ncbi:MAG: VWA domain-containing protein [Bacteroidales bacterium]|nr:VWA domain-containing protein [Bacteroidales bacterium]
MKRKLLKYVIAGFLILMSAIQFSNAQLVTEEEEALPLTRILFVFDASQSMYGRWQSDMKINIAQKLLSNVLDSLRDVPNLELALRVYGHQKTFPPQDCDDTRLEVAFSFKKDNIKQIQHRLKTLVPKGTTPIAYSLEQAGNDFPPCDDCRNIIVLITDGIEECDGDPCAVSQALQKKGIILKPFIIGIGMNFKEAFDCVGTYYDASSEEAFNTALNVVISQALNSTTAQVNLLDEYGSPTETNVNMTFYDNFSGLIKYNFIHTLNNKGIPDTLLIDPLITYNIIVHTIPEVGIDSVKISPGKHTTIPIDAPQGYLNLNIDSYNKRIKNLQCIVRQDGEMQTINVQNFGVIEKYITGIYDIEVLCLPRIYIDDVEIMQSHTTTVEIPLPGIAVIQKSTNGYGSLYVERGDKIELIYNFRDNTPKQESLILQPGKYRVVFRSKYSNRSFYTVEKRFKVESGVTTNVKIYQ